MQESRLFKIVYHLLDKGKATAPELAEKFEVSVRTIYRDIDALSGAGIPVYTETGRNGGIYLMNDFVLDKAVLSEEEKQEIPAPSEPCKFTVSDDEFCVVIEFDMLAYKKRTNSKAVKKTLSIPEWLNEEASALGINFSQVLQEALMQKVGIK